MTYPYVSGAVLLASDLNTDFAAKTDLAMTQNAQTGTSYSFALADASKLLTMSNAASNTVTVTKQANVTWVTGTQLRVINLGVGVTTLVADTGVTINGNVALKQYQGGELIRTASDVWLFVPTASSSGMDLITPTSVAGAGVTLSGGKVTYSAAATVSVNGCFNSTYDNYLVMADGYQSVEGFVNMRLRLSGTDSSAASYSYQRFSAQSTTLSGSNSSSQTSGTLGVFTTTDRNALRVDLFGPALAANTKYFSNCTYGGSNLEIFPGAHIVATAYDGFSLFPASGNMTGTLRVYGLRNS